MNYPIDIVIAWVDGNDSKWQQTKALYETPKNTISNKNTTTSVDNTIQRYRDWENLQYLFRGIEKFAPYVRTVHFVTCGHLPSWLNTKAAKLHIVKHSDYIPEQYLPTFSSHPIELNFHRISELSENFLYFNDDFFFTSITKPDDFFVNGIPRDMLALQPVVANPQNPTMSHIFLNNSLILCKHFNKRNNIKKQPNKYFKLGYPLIYFIYNLLELTFPLFTGFYTTHGPSPLCKSTLAMIWEKEFEVLNNTCNHRFRHNDDVNQYLIREWQKLSGHFIASNINKFLKYFDAGKDNKAIYQAITNQKYKMICLNDPCFDIDFETGKATIIKAFEKILPDKCSFEI